MRSPSASLCKQITSAPISVNTAGAKPTAAPQAKSKTIFMPWRVSPDAKGVWIDWLYVLINSVRE